MNCILFEREEVEEDGRVAVSDDRSAHIRKVLKSLPGHTVRAGIVNGALGEAEVLSIQGREVELRFEAGRETMPAPPLDLLLAVPRPKVLNRLWPQLVAMGVGRILLTKANKVERSYFESHVLAPESYRPRLVQGLQQAGDTRLPEVTVHRRFNVLLEDELDPLVSTAERVMLHPGEGKPLASFRAKGDRVLLAIGPEGGWTEYERERLAEHGFSARTMGGRILRTDTACIAAMALAQARLIEPRRHGDTEKGL